MYNNKKNIGELVKVHSFIDKLNLIDNEESNLKDSLAFYFLGSISSEELVKEFPRNIEVLCDVVNMFLTFDNTEEKMYIVSPAKVKGTTEYSVGGAIDKYNVSLKCNTITEKVFLYKEDDNVDERFYQFNEVSCDDKEQLKNMTLGDWCYVVRNNSLLYDELVNASEKEVKDEDVDRLVFDLRKEIGSGFDEKFSILPELCYISSKDDLTHQKAHEFLTNSNGERSITDEDLDKIIFVRELPKTEIVTEDNFSTYDNFAAVLRDYNDSIGQKDNEKTYHFINKDGDK